MASGLSTQEDITKRLIQEHKQIIAMIEDEEMMEEIEEKLRRNEAME